MSDTYSQDCDFTDEDEAYARWEAQRTPPLTPAEAFDLLFEAWQDAQEDAHMQRVLTAMEDQGRAHGIPARPTP